MVSELPAITDAVKPARLSLPTLLKSSVSTEFEALPDIGRTIKKGRIFSGMRKSFVIGEKRFASISPAPEAVNMEAAVHIKTSPGKSETDVLIPDTAPIVKLSVKPFFEISNSIAVRQRIAGTIEALSNFILTFSPCAPEISLKVCKRFCKYHRQH